MVCRDRLQQPYGNSAAESRSHSAQRESHDAYKCALVKLVDFEWHNLLQRRAIDFKVNHQCPLPIREEKRLSGQRKHSLPRSLAVRLGSITKCVGVSFDFDRTTHYLSILGSSSARADSRLGKR